MKNLFAQHNKKLLENIMSKEPGIIYCNSEIDVNDPIFECELSHIVSQQKEEEIHLFILL